MSKLDENGQVVNEEELDFYLGGNHTVKIGIAEQLCYVNDAGRLFNAKTCPDFFCQVRGLLPDDTHLLTELKGDLEIGFLKSGRQILKVPVGIFGSRSITEHIGIFGTTGSGKSNLVKVLSSAIIDSGNYGLLIFDVHNEYYSDLSRHPQVADRLLVYNSRPDKSHDDAAAADIRKLSLGYHEIEPEDITACAAFSEPQLDAIYKLSAVWQDKWMDYVLKYDIDDIINEVYEATGQKFQSRTISKIKSICWNLKQELNIDEGEDKLKEGQSPAENIMNALEDGKVVLIELKDISPVGEQALSAILSKKLLARYAAKSPKEKEGLRPVLIVLEEAHRFLGKKERTSENIFARLVSEARKFNLGLCVVDQQPRLLADKVLSQLNTLFILGLSSKADRVKLEAMCRKDILKQQNEIKNLDCGEMIIAANCMRFATPVKVHKFDAVI